MGSDTACHAVRLRPGLFQSTLPGWGATPLRDVLADFVTISIHAPRMGSDKLVVVAGIHTIPTTTTSSYQLAYRVYWAVPTFNIDNSANSIQRSHALATSTASSVPSFTSKEVASVSWAIRLRNCSTLATSTAGTVSTREMRSAMSRSAALRASCTTRMASRA